MMVLTQGGLVMKMVLLDPLVADFPASSSGVAQRLLPSCCQDLTSIFLHSESILYNELKMYLVESKGGAILCMLLALFFLGTWPAILTLLERIIGLQFCLQWRVVWSSALGICLHNLFGLS